MKQKKRFYEPPTMQVVELKHHQMLLAGSITSNSPQYMDEEDLGFE